MRLVLARYVLDDEASFEACVNHLERDGHRIRRSWAPDAEAICAGVVVDEGDAADVLLAALGGAGLVVRLDAPETVTVRLLDDLRHLGPLARTFEAVEIPAGIDEDQRRLVALLGGGATVSDAAAELGLSRRSATRRLTALREALGVKSTAEAVVVASRLLDGR